MNQQGLVDFVQSTLRERLAAPTLQVLAVDGLGPAADFGRASTDEKWRLIKYAPDRPDDVEGVLPLQVSYRTEHEPSATLSVLVKARTRMAVGSGLIPDTIQAVGLSLERPYTAYRAARETTNNSLREITLFRLQARYPALQRYLPGYLGDHVDESRNEFLLLERLVTDGVLMDTADDVSGWTAALVGTALEGIADIHAIWYGNDQALAAMDWLPRRLTTDDVLADVSLWQGLAKFARERFPEHVSDAAYRRHLALIDSIATWHPAKDAMPHTVVHDDFNPRNSGFRPLDGRLALIVYDWELTLVDVPQRDLVEMLVFTLSDTVTRAEVDALVERHRARLEAASGTAIARDEWLAGVRCELYLEAINRVPFQWVFHNRFPSAFAVRIGATLERLLDLYADS